MTELAKRRPTRLKGFDYGGNEVYFVTICTHNGQNTLSEIVVGEGLAPPEVKLSALGKIAEAQILNLPTRFLGVTVENYVIMPNHVHLLIFIEGETGGASPSPTLDAVICAFKSLTVWNYKRLCSADKIWQRSFHDHIIRNEKDYSAHWDYIDNNPTLWVLGKDQYVFSEEKEQIL